MNASPRVFRSTLSICLPLSVILAVPAGAAVAPRYETRWETPRPTIVAVSPSGNLVIAEYPITRIRTLSTSGTLLDEWGTVGPGPGQLFNITAMAVSPSGDVYVGTTGNVNAVQKFSAGGAYLGTLAMAGTGPGEVVEATGLAVGPLGDVVVADQTRNLILRFSAAGTFLGDFSLPGGSAGAPHDVAVDAAGRIFVADDGTDDVYRFSSTGVLQAVLQVGGGDTRYSIAIAADGGLLAGYQGFFVKLTADGSPVWQRLNLIYEGAVRVDDIAETSGNLIFVLARGYDLVIRYRPYVGPEPTATYGGSTKILLHVTPVPGSSACRAGEIDDCTQALPRGLTATSSAGPWNFVYLMVGSSYQDRLAGLQVGLTYQSGNPGGREDGVGLDIFSWNSCASQQFASVTPPWPSPGSGNLITWASPVQCQVEKTVIAGYFYVGAYGIDALTLTPHPADGLVKTASCGGAETILPASSLGAAVFSPGAALPGCNPCDAVPCTTPPPPTPVESTTWGAIKAMNR